MIMNTGAGGGVGGGLKVVASGSWDRVTFPGQDNTMVQLDESASLLIVNTVYDEENQNSQQGGTVVLPGHYVLPATSNSSVGISLSADGKTITFRDISAGAATTFYYQALAF